MEDCQVVGVLQVADLQLQVQTELLGCEVDCVECEVLLRRQGREVGFGLVEPKEGPTGVRRNDLLADWEDECFAWGQCQCSTWLSGPPSVAHLPGTACSSSRLLQAPGGCPSGWRQARCMFARPRIAVTARPSPQHQA